MTAFTDFLKEELDYARTRLLATLEGVSDEQILWQPAAGNPSIAAILLHLGRVDDLHLNRAILKQEQVWERDGWQKKLGLPDPTQFPTELGWTIDSAAGQPRITLKDLLSYAQATREAMKRFLETASEEQLAQEIDDGLERHKGWTVAKHIAHCALHESHHQGQIDYVKGLNLALAKR
ncbi:MAG TPA: DinB family protein [Dehalococcoidia bacterium]|nr:DinB family protein [Dehalococcoidia bacterium]